MQVYFGHVISFVATIMDNPLQTELVEGVGGTGVVDKKKERNCV
jgi:hypothetical protein